MSSKNQPVNFSLVALLTALGLPLAVCAFGFAYLAYATAERQRDDLETLLATVEAADADVLSVYVDQITRRSVRATRPQLEDILDQHLTEARAKFDAALADQQARNAEIEQELAAALATIEHLIASQSLEAVSAASVLSQEDLAFFASQDLAPDPAVGLELFAACSACHSVTPDRSNGIGPSLWALYGGKAASVEDFAYSKALRDYDAFWTAETLSAFLANPRGAIRGTSMGYAGLPNAQARADVIAYLATLK